eukprot:136899_1
MSLQSITFLTIISMIDNAYGSVIAQATFGNFLGDNQVINGGGKIAFFQNKVWYDLDFSGVDWSVFDNPNCTWDGLSFHIHEKWEWDDSGPLSNKFVDRIGSECNESYTGKHYDPWMACGPGSANPECIVNGGCIPPSSIYEESDSYQATYSCDEENFNLIAYACEIGDLSGKYGYIDPIEWDNTTNETIGIHVTDTFGSYWEILPNLIWVDNQVLAKYSLVIHCGDAEGEPLFCAPILKNTDNFVPDYVFPDPEDVIIDLSEAGVEFENFTISFDSQGVSFHVPATTANVCSAWDLKLYEEYPYFADGTAFSNCDVDEFSGIYDPTHTCIENSGSLYCQDEIRCPVQTNISVNYYCNSTNNYMGCAVGDISARIGEAIQPDFTGGDLFWDFTYPITTYAPPLFILADRGIILTCLDDNNASLGEIINVCGGTFCENCTQTLAPITNITNPPTQPSYQPTFVPTFVPTYEPTLEPTTDPTFEPTYEPTSYPTNEPTLEPTTNPTTSNPTSVPTKTPTKTPSETPTRTPTPAPTYPRVKYKFHQILVLTTSSGVGCAGCLPFDLSITLFIWIDPNGASYARITLTGPNDRSFMVLFTQYEFPLGGLEFWQWAGEPFFNALSGKNVTGFIVQPNNPTAAGEVVIDKGSNTSYDDFGTRYEQNSNIDEFDTTYKNDTALITFSRTVTTTDIDDWQFKFKELIDQFYICFAISKPAPNDGDFRSSDCGCVTINQEPADLNSGFKGNFGIRGKFESDPNHALSPPPFTIYFEWDPFLFIYSGYVIKPKDTWLLWGDYDQTNETKSIADRYEWDYATFCDKDGTTEFVTVIMLPQRVAFGFGQTWVTGTDDYTTTHRINFTIDRAGAPGPGDIFDMDNFASGWNTVKFLNTREITFNIFYGDNNNDMISDQANQIDKYYASVMVYLDYVTYDPTNEPTTAPTRGEFN